MYKVFLVYTHQGETYIGGLTKETDKYIVLEDCTVDDCEKITRLKQAKIYKHDIAYKNITRY
ncbi:MAG: hypothetical protein MSA56_08020 [Clostridium sp.]|nr:hypothetical protein [Clostridium sp.]